SLRGGTSNALVNVVLAKTLRIALSNKKEYHQHIIDLHERLIEGLKDIASINYDIGIDTLVNISTPIPSEVLLNALNAKGIMVSSKSTCGSRKNEPNRTLSNMGIDENYAIRVSFDYTNTIEEIDYFISTLKEVLDRYA
ncbi:MAG: aminotransferase class V-fold PLP-dependent enzyme, partial [Erysipelotrichaceae bacterium]|nr:aminotransferase class V-fold PLP-dependent enzyme [Erysipelotrichaceae bacterium]